MLVQHLIEINAPREKVWEVTTDVLQWPRWNPTVTAVHVVGNKPLTSGSIVKIKQPGQPEAKWIVTHFSPMEFFAWESQRFGLKFRASHKILLNGPLSTSTLQLEATGILSIVLYPILKFAISKALSEENNELKLRCEE